MLQDPNIERYVSERLRPLEEQIKELQAEMFRLMQAKSLHLQNVRRSFSWEDLQPGDNVIFDKVMSKLLTVGREYVVTRVGKDWSKEYDSFFEIKDDNNKRKWLRKHPKGYIVRLA